MPGDSSARRVLVGVADNEEAALRYAVQRAQSLGCGLRVIHVFDVPASGLHTYMSPAIVEGFEEHGRDVLARAENVVWALDPGLDVDYQLVRGRAVNVLLSESESAAEVVLGPDLSPWWISLYRGRVARSLTAHAQVPVTVVPQSWSAGTLDPRLYVQGAAESGDA